MYLWQEQDGFHEACEYFYAHLGEAEKDHKIEAMKAAERYADSEDSLRAIEFGFRKHLNLIAEFWTGLAVAVQEAGLKATSTGSALAAVPIGTGSDAS
jgi:hypothetical protein